MKIRHSSNRYLRAFTLLEIMVALSLFTLVLVAIFSTWSAIIKGSEGAKRVAAEAQRRRIAMSTVQEALLGAMMFQQNAKYYGFVADSDGNYSSLDFVSRLPSTFLRGTKFGIMTTRRVNFTVQTAPDGKQQLVLRQTPILLDPDKDEMQNPVVLARDVNKFVLEYWDPQKGDFATDWQDTNQLPQLVRITLAIGKVDQFSSEPQDVMYSTVALPARMVRKEWQMGQGGGGGVQPVGNNPPGSSVGNQNFKGNPGNPGAGTATVLQ